MKVDLCEYCNGEVENRVIRARFSFKGETVYVDNVPAWVCAKCGEQYFDAPVYKKLEEIARHRDCINETICFPLADYEMAFS
jgi:YgiT-type zinc finger domain-containing protein